MKSSSDTSLNLDDKLILVTGGTGSFGRRFAEILDMGDHYVICPPQYPRIAEHHEARGGAVVPRGFRYTSDTNDHWISAAELQSLLADSGV